MPQSVHAGIHKHVAIRMSFLDKYSFMPLKIINFIKHAVMYTCNIWLYCFVGILLSLCRLLFLFQLCTRPGETCGRAYCFPGIHSSSHIPGPDFGIYRLGKGSMWCEWRLGNCVPHHHLLICPWSATQDILHGVRICRIFYMEYVFVGYFTWSTYL